MPKSVFLLHPNLLTLVLAICIARLLLDPKRFVEVYGLGFKALPKLLCVRISLTNIDYYLNYSHLVSNTTLS